MIEKYMAYPLTIKGLAYELINVFNDYRARKIDNSTLREVVFWYADNCPEKLFNGADLNTTIKRVIGIQRTNLLNTVLDGYQNSLIWGKSHGNK